MWWRRILLTVQAVVALTSAAGGIALMSGSNGSLGITPPPGLLAGSPFDSYVIPGLILLIVVGGTHLVAFLLLLRSHPSSPAWCAVAGFGLLIWIFVQMTIIPFSVLQAVYFGLGLLELALVLVLSDVLPARAVHRARGERRATRDDF